MRASCLDSFSLGAFDSRGTTRPDSIPMTIVLEGLPACGKTSVANALRDALGFFKVNESLGYLPIDATDDQETIFHETREKYRRARQHAASIIDRGYPSMLAWDVTTEGLGGPQRYTEKKEWVDAAIDRGELYEPELYVYLDITPELSLERRPRLASPHDVWTTIEGLRFCQQYYEDFFSRRDGVLRVDASQSLTVVQKIIQEGINAISTPHILR